MSSRLNRQRLCIANEICAQLHGFNGTAGRCASGVDDVVLSVVDYFLEGLSAPGLESATVPAIAIDGAREAAWSSLSLQDLLERYFASYYVLLDTALLEVESLSNKTSPRALHGATHAIFAGVISAVATAYSEERARRARSRKTVIFERTVELLNGRRRASPEHTYTLDAHHLAIVGKGSMLDGVLADAARSNGHQVLLTGPLDIVWGWIGSHELQRLREFEATLHLHLPSEAVVASGEIWSRSAGWRRSHHQARAAYSIAEERSRQFIRYSSVALLASASQDELLTESLAERFMVPIEDLDDSNGTLEQTVRVFLSTGCAVSATASLLGIKRHTVTNRIRLVENRLGFSLHSHLAELELALQIFGPAPGEACGRRPGVVGSRGEVPDTSRAPSPR